MSVRFNVLAAWFEHAVKLFVGFFLMKYLMSMLGETYGVWVFINSLIGYSGLLYMGFGDTISRYTAKHHANKDWDKLNQTASCVFSFYLGMGVIAFLVSVIFAGLAPYISDWAGHSISEIRITFLILGFSIMIAMSGSAFGGLLIGMQRFDLERGVLVVMGLIRLGLTVALLQQQYGLITLASIFLAVTVLENLFFVVMSFRVIPTLKLSKKFISKEAYKECFSFSFFAFLGLIAEFLIYHTDTIVIGLVISMEAVVPYYVASRLCTFIREPVIQIGEIFLPRAGELHTTDRMHQLSKLVLNGMGVAFLLTSSALIGGYFFADLMIETWLTTDYEFISSQLLLVLLLGQLVALPMTVLRRVLFGMGDVRIPSFIYLSEAIANLILSLILVVPFGLFGVALGTIIPITVIEVGFLLPYAIKKFHFSFGEMIQKVFVVQTVPLLALFTFCFLLSPFITSRDWLTVGLVLSGALFVTGSSWYMTNRKILFAKSKISHAEVRQDKNLDENASTTNQQTKNNTKQPL